jgi:hypothetical protein
MLRMEMNCVKEEEQPFVSNSWKLRKNGGKIKRPKRGVQYLDTFSQMRTFNNLFHPPLVALMV